VLSDHPTEVFAMIVLLLLWAALGPLVALVVRAARVWPAGFPAPRWRTLLAGGALAGLLGGWLGSLAFGRFYGAPTALWFSAVVLVAGPWVARNLTGRPSPRERGNPLLPRGA
jgi:hypothetical protein